MNNSLKQTYFLKCFMDYLLCCSVLRKGVVYSIVCGSILDSVQLEDKTGVL